MPRRPIPHAALTLPLLAALCALPRPLRAGAAISNSGTLNFTTTTSITSIIGNPTTPSHYTGTTTVSAPGSLTADFLRQDSLTINASATATLRETGGTLSSGWPSGSDAAVSIIKNLDLKAGTSNFVGTLNLTNNDLIVDYTGSTSPAATLEAAVRSAYNHGTWSGPGLTSSDAALRNIFTLLVLDNATLATPLTSFDTITIPTTTVIVKFTHQCDLNGDGVVTGTGPNNDLSLFAAYYAAYNVDTGTSTNRAVTHAQGDMDFDGLLTFNDAQLFTLYYNESLAHLPEPTTLTLLALGAAALLTRKRS